MFAINNTLIPLNEFDEIIPGHTHLMLSNNTLLTPLIRRNITNNTWELSVIDLHKLTDRDHGYSNTNTNIKSTFPKINDSLKFSDITNISINFYDSVKSDCILSNINISTI